MRKSQVFIILSLVLLSACGGDKRYGALMHQADSLLTAGEAATAYTLLAEADSQKTAWSRRQRMAYELLKAQVQNLAYVDFQTDSVMREVARYYDRHGTANERLKAHYLLGCVYRDLHEAPLAILAWEDAVAAADTLNPTCDYATLSRVYGQMANIYFRQYLPEKQLEAGNAFCHYALLGGDTLYYISGLLKMNDAYLALGDTTTIYRNIEHVQQLYRQRGLTAKAAQVYPTAIMIALDNQQFERASYMMKVFEMESGLFDECGNIARGYERYYYQKGRYLMAIEQVDSAELLFRRLLSFNDLKADGYRGLLSVFKYKRQIDSLLKYNQLYEYALVKYQNSIRTTAITQAEGMYDYHRHERIAQEQKQKTHQREIILTLVITFAFFVGVLTYLYIRRERKEKEQAMNKLMKDYGHALNNLAKAKTEKQLLKESLVNKESAMTLLKEKAEQVQQLESLVRDLQTQISQSPEIIISQQIEESGIMKHFHQIAHPHYEDGTAELRKMIDARAATPAEWEELMEAVRLCHPSFYLFIKEHKLSSLKSKLCILSRFGFDNQEIATLANAKIGSVTNARTALAKELFELDSSRELDRNLQSI